MNNKLTNQEMQTFLPYRSFVQSAKVLDYRRLGKQRVEAYQILKTLSGESQGWQNHPAVKMWKGYELLLAEYGLDMCNEWIARGYNDSLKPKFLDYMCRYVSQVNSVRSPHWLGDESFHASHRSNLLRKDGTHYSQFGWTEPPDLEYVWPVPDFHPLQR